MNAWLRESTLALRSLAKRPAFSIMIVATLALGIGASTALFSILHALVLRSLPVADPGRLVVVSRNQISLQYPLFRYLEAHSTTLEGVAAFRSASWRVRTATGTERIKGTLVSGSYFRVLGVMPALGSAITEADDATPGAGGRRGAVAVLGHGFWIRQFGGEPGVVGSRVFLNEHPFTIVGVAPPGFTGTEVGDSPDVFAPMTLQPVLLPSLGRGLFEARSNWIRIIARLGRGVDSGQDEAELTALQRAYNQQILDSLPGAVIDAAARRSLLEQRISLLPGSAGISGLRQQYSKPLAVLMAVMGLVLLVMCANIASLLLSRAASRRHETAIKLGLGASRPRLIAGLLSESLFLALAGTVAGVLLARVGRDTLLTYLPTERILDAPLDRSVLLFAAALAAGGVLLFGLVPALQSTSLDVAPELKSGGGRKSARAPFRKALVGFQVAVSLVVVLGSVLFLRSLQALLSGDAGVERESILMAAVDVPQGRAMEVYPRLLAEMRTLPGVSSAALSDSGPLGTHTGWNIFLPGYVPGPDEPRESPWVGFISPGYFATMAIPLLAGRDFDDRDVSATRNVMIVNETFARHYFGAENPIGRSIGLRQGIYDVEIVGVVKDVKATGLREAPLRMVYVPYRPGPWGLQMVVHLRTSGPPTAVAASFRQRIRQLDETIPVFGVRTVREEIAGSLLRERLVATLSGLFGGLALLLAAIGLYGVLSHGVARRTREFGIRIAVGAGPGDIATHVLSEAGRVVGAGIAGGLLSAWLLARVVSSLLYGVDAGDPVSAGIAVAVLAASGGLAAWLPARRASRVDPILALRNE
jgi:predicted permease